MRYSDYLNAVAFHHKTISYNVLAPKIDPNAPVPSTSERSILICGRSALPTARIHVGDDMQV